MSAEFSITNDLVAEIAERFGTPLFVYDGDALDAGVAALRTHVPAALDILFSLKANPNVSVCATLCNGGAGAEVSSLTELRTARWAGVQPRDIIFLGPGKSRQEIAACVEEAVYAVVAESIEELRVIEEVAQAAGRGIDVLLRVNPAFSVKGSGLTMGGKARQFGVDEAQLLESHGVGRDLDAARLTGVHAYMGTRILDAGVVADNTERILALAERLADAVGFELEAVDVGGGLGVAYFDGEQDPDLDELSRRLGPIVETFTGAHPRARLLMELGRYLTARAGLYVVRARYVKTSHGERFVVADGGSNHHMAAVGIGSFVRRNFPIIAVSGRGAAAAEYTLTGPLCTPADTLGRGVPLPEVRPGDLLGVQRSGAYGPSASPGRFLSHGFPAEVLVRRGEARLVRRRDEPDDLLHQQLLVNTDAELALAGSASTERKTSDP